MTKETDNGYPWASDELVLLFSDSFDEGAILTKDAFILFLRKALREEVATMDYVFLTPTMASYGTYEFYGTLDMDGMLLGSLGLQ